MILDRWQSNRDSWITAQGTPAALHDRSRGVSFKDTGRITAFLLSPDLHERIRTQTVSDDGDDAGVATVAG